MLIDQNVDIFENDIDMYINIFCEEHNIEDLRSASQNVWNGCLLYIQRKLFKGTGVLKTTKPLPNVNSFNPTCNAYDMNKVSSICDYYIYLCNIFDKEVSIIGFTKLTGISQDCIFEWARGERKSSQVGCEIYKKLTAEREESLSAKLATGKQNPVGIISILNHHYGWSQPGVTKEITARKPLDASQLPQLGHSGPENVVQIAQQENGEK